MHQFYIVYLALVLASCSQAQAPVEPKLVGGPCEGCEAVFEFQGRHLRSVDTLPDFNDAGERIKVEGTVYLLDGHTPASDVVLYVYHTDQSGLYPTKGDESGWAKRHGYIRGWVKTDQAGHYAFYTLKPAVYPSRTEAAHIHLTVLEPDGKYYWLGSYFFEGDTLLEGSDPAPRGGSNGVMKLEDQDGILVGKRDIVLGRNVEGY